MAGLFTVVTLEPVVDIPPVFLPTVQCPLSGAKRTLPLLVSGVI